MDKNKTHLEREHLISLSSPGKGKEKEEKKKDGRVIGDNLSSVGRMGICMAEWGVPEVRRRGGPHPPFLRGPRAD